MSTGENLADSMQQRYLKSYLAIEAVDAVELAIEDEISEHADQRLKQFGGVALLLDRMTPQEKRLWQPSDISLGASTVPDGHGESHVLLSATRRTPAGRPGKLGVHTVVGRRVRGSSFWVVPVGASPSLLILPVRLLLDAKDYMTTESLGSGLIGIHKSFAETEYGQQLAANVRYERYKPEDVTNERWVQLLGADVNNLSHLTLTYGLARDFVLHQDEADPTFLSDQEKETLLVAALIHDWAEAIVGDLSWDEKTEDDEREEMAAFDRNLSDFYPDGSSDVRDKIKVARDEVIFNQDSRLGRIFNAIERVGYVRTALRASRQVSSGNALDCEDGLRWIVCDVFGNHITRTLEYARDYPPVHQFMTNKIDEITAAFGVVGNEVFDNYKPEQRGQEVSEFVYAQLRWGDWVQSMEPVTSTV